MNLQKTHRDYTMKKTPGLYSHLFALTGHVLLAFLPAYLLPVFVFWSAPELLGSVNPSDFIDRAGFNVLVIHGLGWYRGLHSPIHKEGEMWLRAKNWLKIIGLFAGLQLLAYVYGGTVDLRLLLDISLMCWAYFNGIFAGGYLSRAAVAYGR